MKSPWSESRMREIRTSGLMSGEWKRSGSYVATAPLLDSTTRFRLGRSAEMFEGRGLQEGDFSS